ncbi:unnamed protein product, partial [Scytosiphon promiscuus]
RWSGLCLWCVATTARTDKSVYQRNPRSPNGRTSAENSIIPAGGVWYPDSAHKTAQAIQDLNHEGLPLMVFANWRGFSGGQRDMFDEVGDGFITQPPAVFLVLP